MCTSTRACVTHSFTCTILSSGFSSLIHLSFDSTFFSMTPFDGEELIVALGDRDKAESGRRMQREDEGTKRSEGEDRGRADG